MLQSLRGCMRILLSLRGLYENITKFDENITKFEGVV